MCLYLVSAALAGLQAGQDLALYSGHPGVPVLQALGLKVPRLPGERHHDKVCVLFLCKKKKKKKREAEQTRVRFACAAKTTNSPWINTMGVMNP